MAKRNYSIDILKFVCAVLVVVLHTNFRWHNIILPLTRCAVPCFLMISGFLLYSEKGIGKGRLLRNIKHIAHILLWSTILFAVVKESQYAFYDNIFTPSIRQWVYFIIFNENPFGGHLWYLSAYLYVLVFMMAIDKYKLYRALFYFAPILILSDLVLGKYSLLLLNHEYPYVFVRNFLFVGIPYFTIGCIIKKYMASLKRMNCHIYLGGGNSVFCNIFNRKDNIVEFRKESCKGTLFEHHFSCFLSIYVCCVI